LLQTWLDRHPAWVSDWTRQRAAAGVQACFNWALRLGLIDKNPFKGFRVPGGERGQPMEDAEFQAIMRHSPPVFRRLAIALKFTGARPGELIKATLENVEDGVIVLHKHKTSKKTKKPRRIILHPVMQKYVAWRRRQQWPTNLLFPNRCWRKWRNPTICYRLKRVKKLGLIRKDTTLYGLRHAAVTRLILANVSLPIVAEFAGHERIQTTMTYSHVQKHTDHVLSALKLAFQKPA
jgi:integrase